jgi:hypothetical protein
MQIQYGNRTEGSQEDIYLIDKKENCHLINLVKDKKEFSKKINFEFNKFHSPQLYFMTKKYKPISCQPIGYIIDEKKEKVNE